MPDERVIQVQGHGEVEAAPDIAVIDLGVVSRETVARSAMQAASEKMRAIIEAVKTQGVADADIQTTGLRLYLDTEANVYQSSHQLTIRAEDVTKAGAILDAAVEAGANASAGVHFALADQSGAEDRALQVAVADARRKAEKLASALGVTILHVDQVHAAGHGPVSLARGPGRVAHFAAAQPFPVESGQLTIGADVQVTYSFE